MKEEEEEDEIDFGDDEAEIDFCTNGEEVEIVLEEANGDGLAKIGWVG